MRFNVKMPTNRVPKRTYEGVEGRDARDLEEHIDVSSRANEVDSSLDGIPDLRPVNILLSNELSDLFGTLY